jgi:hypothetical protein
MLVIEHVDVLTIGRISILSCNELALISDYMKVQRYFCCQQLDIFVRLLTDGGAD